MIYPRQFPQGYNLRLPRRHRKKSRYGFLPSAGWHSRGYGFFWNLYSQCRFRWGVHWLRWDTPSVHWEAHRHGLRRRGYRLYNSAPHAPLFQIGDHQGTVGLVAAVDESHSTRAQSACPTSIKCTLRESLLPVSGCDPGGEDSLRTQPENSRIRHRRSAKKRVS